LEGIGEGREDDWENLRVSVLNTNIQGEEKKRMPEKDNGGKMM
jgi:hypothetical protein